MASCTSLTALYAKTVAMVIGVVMLIFGYCKNLNMDGWLLIQQRTKSQVGLGQFRCKINLGTLPKETGLVIKVRSLMCIHWSTVTLRHKTVVGRFKAYIEQVGPPFDDCFARYNRRDI